MRWGLKENSMSLLISFVYLFEATCVFGILRFSCSWMEGWFTNEHHLVTPLSLYNMGDWCCPVVHQCFDELWPLERIITFFRIMVHEVTPKHFNNFEGYWKYVDIHTLLHNLTILVGNSPSRKDGATPQRWISLHGSCAIYFSGGIFIYINSPFWSWYFGNFTRNLHFFRFHCDRPACDRLLDKQLGRTFAYKIGIPFFEGLETKILQPKQDETWSLYKYTGQYQYQYINIFNINVNFNLTDMIISMNIMCKKGDMLIRESFFGCSARVEEFSRRSFGIQVTSLPGGSHSSDKMGLSGYPPSSSPKK